MRARVAAGAVATACAAGCGAQPPDLFSVQRTGAGPNARLDMVVSDGGAVRCNGRSHTLGAERLLRARALARALAPQAELGLELPPGRGTVLSYRVRLQTGTVAFSDSSPRRPRSFTALEAFTKDVAEDVCGIRR